MAYEYSNPKTYPSASREELIEAANRGLGGQGAVVEAMFRLMDTIGAEEKAIKGLTRWLLVFTVAICLLTAGLVWLGWAQLHPTIQFAPPPRFGPPL